MVGWWWGLYLLMNFVNQVAFRTPTHDETVAGLLVSSWANFYGNLICLPAALLAIMVVLGVDANQQRRYVALQGGEAGWNPAGTADDFYSPR